MSALFALNALPTSELHRVGGKAAGLASLFKIGVSVPEGVVIPSDTLLTDALCDELDYYLVALTCLYGADLRFAVRSSAISEDGTAASYAGMYRTILDVRRDKVFGAIEECRRSATSQRLANYTASMQRQQDDTDHVAVIVQRMLEPDISGVCFTMNPVDGDQSQMVVEAVSGLGERLVSGAATPDYYLFDWHTGNVLREEPGEHAPMGTMLLQSSDKVLLWGQARAVGQWFGWPVDIEFSFSDGDLYFLQARPITTRRGERQETTVLKRAS